MSQKHTMPLTFSEQERQRIAAGEKRRSDAQTADAKKRAARDQLRSENAQLRVQGARIYEDSSGKMIGGRRYTCFTVLLRNADEEAKAVSWLEDLIRDASGEAAIERRPDHIRSSVEGAPGQTVTQKMVDASRTLRVVEAGLRPWEAQLLFTLLKPDYALLTRWRETVQAITGEVNDQAQGARVRAACEGLLFVKREMMRQHKQAA